MNGVPFSEGSQNGGLPAVSTSYQAFGARGNDPAHEGQNDYQIMDNVTKVIGNNSLKMGFEAMPMRFCTIADGTPRGAYSYSSTFTGVTGLGGPSGYAGADFPAHGTNSLGAYTGTDNMNSGSISTYLYQHYVHQYLAGYLQDDWKVTQKLTLNLGLRYEYFTPQLEQDDQWGNFVQETEQMTSNGGTGSGFLVLPASQRGTKLDPNLQALLTQDNIQVTYSTNRHLVSFPKANWSPRVGAAYQLNDKTVVRAGAGVFMGGFEPGGNSALTQNPPFIMNASLASLPSCTQGSYCESQYAFNNTLEGGLGGFEAAGGIQHFASFPSIMQAGEGPSPTMNMPYTINYNLSVQRAFWKDTTATVAYVGSLGMHLVTDLNNPNRPMALTIGGQSSNGLTPFPHFSGAQWVEWTAHSAYDGLQATVQKHYSHGLSFLGTYTWAHAFDNANDVLGGDYGGYRQSYLIPINHEWGQSGYDTRQRAVINVDYDLPFGVGRQWVNHPGVLDRIIGGENNTAIKVANPYSSNLTPPANYATPITASGMTTGANSNTAANVCAAQTKTRQRWFNPCAFADPLGVGSSSNAAAIAALAPYQTGTFSYYSPAIGADNALADGQFNTNGTTNSLGPVPYVTGYAAVAPFFGSSRNNVSGPGNWKLNASMFKDFKIFREQYLEFRADAFNILNHPSLGNPGSTSRNIGANAVAITGTGSEQNLTIDARFFQLSGKYVF